MESPPWLLLLLLCLWLLVPADHACLPGWSLVLSWLP